MNVRLLAVGLIGLAALSACTEPPDPKSFCGTGTRLEESKCVPIPEATCPTGQARISGTCRPICGTNTQDTPTGCVLAEGACSKGTELKDGACVAIDPMNRVQVREAAEPNQDPKKGTTFELPAAGADPVVLGGSVGAPTMEGADFDAFVFTAEAGSRIRVSALAVGAPSVAARIYPLFATSPAQAQQLSSYVYSGTSRTAARELNIPLAGDWVVEVSLPSNFDAFGGLPGGAEAFTYTVDVSRLAPATAANLVSGTPSTGTWASGGIYSVASTASTVSLYEAKLEQDGAMPFMGLRRVTAVDRQGKLLGISTDTMDQTGAVKALSAARFALPASGATLYVDYVAAQSELGGYKVTGTIKDVDVITVPTTTPVTGSLADDGIHVFSFDVQAIAKVAVKASRTSGSDIEKFHCELRDAAFGLVAESTASSTYTTSLSLSSLARTDGSWFVVCEDASFKNTASGDYSITLDVSVVPVVNLGSVGAPASISTATPGDAINALTLVAPPGASSYSYYTALATFTLTKDGYVTVTTTPAPSTADTKVDIKVRAADLTLIKTTYWSSTRAGQSGNPGGNKTDKIALAAGSYVIEVEGDSSSTRGDVDVMVETEAADWVNEVEPNDTEATAQAITMATTTASVIAGRTTTGDNKDFFTFEVAAPTRLKVSTKEFGKSTGYFKIALRAQGSTAVLDDESTIDAATSLSTTSTVQPGTYVVEVTYDDQYYYDPYYDDAPPVSPVGGYMLTVELTP